MTDTRAQYAVLAERLAVVADTVPPDAWDRPSPCQGWSAAEVLGHMQETQRSFLTERGIQAAVTSDAPAPETPEPDDLSPAAAWRAHVDTMTASLAPAGVTEAGFDGFFGPTTVGEALLTFYGFDMIVHRWDIARSTGGDEAWSTEEQDQVEANMASFGPALHMEGICGPEIELPDDADRQQQLLARSGRDPRR